MNKFYSLIILAFMMALTSLPADAARTVYRLNLDDEINSETWHLTREALKEATARDAELILVHLNTYGGSVVHADSIRTALMNYPRPVVAYVDPNAASAGALIALACDSVYMRPGSTMGAVTVVNGADGTAMPDKYQSYMRAMMRATAEHHGRYLDTDSIMQWRRDPLIAEAMVDHRVEVPGLIDTTRVLTFTSNEAIKWKYADGMAHSVDDVLSQLGYEDYVIEQYHPTWVDRLIGFFTSPGVQAILIMIILAGIYMELQTPGVGFPSAAAIIAAVLYFLPLYLTGIASSWIVLLFLLGLILVVFEMFVIPGFGITGIAGIGCICAALIIGLIEHYTFSLGHIDSDALWSTVMIFLSGTVLAVGGVVYMSSSYGPKWLRRRTDLTLTQQVDDGYIGVDMTPSLYVGLEGVCTTDLRPAGKVEIDGKTFFALSMDDFLNAGDRIKVIKYENAQVYVKRI